MPKEKTPSLGQSPLRRFGRAAAAALIALTLTAGSGGTAAIAAPAAVPASVQASVQAAALKKIPHYASPYLDGNRTGIGDRIFVFSHVFKPTGVKFTYQWYRDGKAIKGDTAATHKLVAADKRKKLHVVVTGHKAGYASTSLKTGTLVFDFKYKLHGKPTIEWVTTHPTVGTTYRANTDYAKNGTIHVRTDKLTYQWKLNGKPIKGATKSKYKVKSADYGKKLNVTVKAHARGFTPSTNTSTQTGTIKKGYATYKKDLFVKGKAKVGHTLGVTDGKWLKGAKLSYRWYYLKSNNDGWKPISGATKSKYKIPAKYAGKQIYVKVTGSKAGYISSSAWSSWSGVIAK